MNPTTLSIRHIYVISESGTNNVKIGISNKPVKRRAEVQTGNPRKLEILATWQGTEKDESDLHALFSQYRKEGEWFELPSYILSLLLSGDLSSLTQAITPEVTADSLTESQRTALAHIDQLFNVAAGNGRRNRAVAEKRKLAVIAYIMSGQCVPSDSDREIARLTTEAVNLARTA